MIAAKKFRMLIRASALLGTLVLALSLAQPASAHTGVWDRTRAGCLYVGAMNSAHDYAYTERRTGSCSGHAWLKVQFSNCLWTDDLHALPRVSTTSGYNQMRKARHKTQSSDSWSYSHNAAC